MPSQGIFKMHPAMSDLSRLPVGERIVLVQELWDSIAESRDQLPIQQWQRELVNNRLAEFSGREIELGLSRDQVWAAVDHKRGI